jgi:hypothetical protein
MTLPIAFTITGMSDRFRAENQAETVEATSHRELGDRSRVSVLTQRETVASWRRGHENFATSSQRMGSAGSFGINLTIG